MFLLCFSVAVVLSVSTVAVQGRAAVAVVSTVTVQGRAVVTVVSLGDHHPAVCDTVVPNQ